MKLIRKKFFRAMVVSWAIALPIMAGLYKEEFEALKKRRPIVFSDRDPFVDPLLINIQKDIENYKELDYKGRLARCPLLAMGGFVVTAESMPKLYSFVDGVCSKHGIKMPTLFVSTQKGFFNAVAAKLFMSSGGIIVGHDLLIECSDQVLEAIIAHEVGHLRYNHVNKKVFVRLVGGWMGAYFARQACKVTSLTSMVTAVQLGSLLLSSLLIGKRFEKEADEFACKEMGKEDGLIEFFKNCEEKEIQQDRDFEDTYTLLEESKPSIGFSDYYYSLLPTYYLAKCYHNINKACRWLYTHTPLGEHPSYQARIKAAQRSKAQRNKLKP